MQHGALKACRSALSELLIHPCDFRKKKVGVELKSLIEETRPAGIIVAAPLSNMPKIVRAIEATGTPFVRISPGKTNGKQLSVSTNDREVCAEMTRYLAGLGHKRIAFITGDPNHAAVANRFLGYQDGLDESGLEYSEQLVAAGDNSFGSGEACAAQTTTWRPVSFVRRIAWASMYRVSCPLRVSTTSRLPDRWTRH
jgi:LacI family transcriptional regulator